MARNVTNKNFKKVTCLVTFLAFIFGQTSAQEFNGYSQQISPHVPKKKDTVLIDTAYLNGYYRLCKLYGITPLAYRNEKIETLIKRYQGNYGTVSLLKPLPSNDSIQLNAELTNANITETTSEGSAPHRMVLDDGRSMDSPKAISVSSSTPEVVDQLTDPASLTPISSSNIASSNEQLVGANDAVPNLSSDVDERAAMVPLRKTPESKPISRGIRDTVVNPIDQNKRNLMRFGGSDTRMYVPEEQVGIRVEPPKDEGQIAASSDQRARSYPSSYLSVSGKEEEDVKGVPLGRPITPQKRHIYMPSPAPSAPVSIENANFDKELNFVVQIAACKKPLTPTYLASLYKNGRRVMVIQEGGWYKYFIVSSGSYEYAKKTLKAVPVDGAFIAAYTKDGTKQELWKAKQQAKQQLESSGEMTYVVQLAASRKPASNFELRRLYYNPEKIIIIKEGGWYKYQLSFGNSLDDAMAFKKTLKYNEESFITGYDKNGVAHMIK